MQKNIGDSQIELCIATYQRPYRLYEIVNDLLAQTNQDFNLNIWNNSGKDLTPFLTKFPQDRLQVINSEKNEGSAARFKLIPHTKGSCIIFFDDDEVLEKDFVAYHFAEWSQWHDEGIVGWYTRTFIYGGYSPSFDDAPYGTQVDYIGTGGMVCDRKIFEKHPELLNIPEPYDKVEDLYLSWVAKKNNIMLIKGLKKCSIMVDGKDQFNGINKNEIFKRMKDEGFPVLKEQYEKGEAFVNLVDFKECADKVGIPFIIIDGTSLGIYRDKDFPPDDWNDIDVGVWDEYIPKLPLLFEELRKIGFEALEPHFEFFEGEFEGGGFKRGGNHIDVCILREYNGEAFNLGRDLGKSFTKKGYFATVVKSEHYRKSEQHEFYGKTFDLPYDMEGYCKERYGEDWRTPCSQKTFRYWEMPSIKPDYYFTDRPHKYEKEII